MFPRHERIQENKPEISLCGKHSGDTKLENFALKIYKIECEETKGRKIWVLKKGWQKCISSESNFIR